MPKQALREAWIPPSSERGPGGLAPKAQRAELPKRALREAWIPPSSERGPSGLAPKAQRAELGDGRTGPGDRWGRWVAQPATQAGYRNVLY